jgi:hypothetical protein
MAVTRNESSKLTLPLMLASFLVIGGFMFYLNQASKAFEVAVVQADDVGADRDMGSARTVTLAELVGAPESFAGERVQLADAQVVSRVGDVAFWVETPADSYYLIRLLPEAAGLASELQTGALATVTGTVHMMSDSVLSAWEGAGVITGGQRAEAEFATSFFEASQIELRGPSGS